MTPITDPLFYAFAIPAVIMVGLAKGGFGGPLSLLGVPLMSLTIAPVQAAGIMLPILVVMDMAGLFAYRGIYDTTSLKILLPAAIVGIAIGYFTAAFVSEAHVRLLIGVVAILFTLNAVAGARAGAEPRPSDPGSDASGARSPASPASSAMPADRPIRSTCFRCASIRCALPAHP